MSSGRQNQEHSLLNVSASLDQCSQLSDDGVSVRSIKLDFGSANDGDVDDENEADAGNSNSGAERQADNVDEGLNARHSGRRRQTVFWSADEEEFLRRGVAKYGTGKWKTILIDGQDVFSKHRTNVDLKDKWKNMQRTNLTNRKRMPEENNLTPSVKQEEQPNVHHVSRASAKKSRSSNDASEISSVDGVRLRTNRRTAVVADRAMASAKRQEVDDDSLSSTEDEDYPAEERGAGSDFDSTGSHQLSEQIVLKFATDKSFPKLTEVGVSFDTCKDVSALKKLLRSSILSDLSPDTEIQMTGLESRQLFEDDELLLRCIKRNGVDFFLVFEEAPDV